MPALSRFIFPLSLMMTLSACSKEAQSPSVTVEQLPVAELIPQDAGKKLYARCRACHTVNEGGKHRVGPNLWGVMGRKAGAMDGYAYSKVMTASDIIWSEETIDAYIANPKTFMPGNKMVFIGLKKQQDRESLIAYLKANTGPQ